MDEAERLTISDPIARSALRKATWRIIPLIALGYGCAYMDRANISFASLQMNRDLHFSSTVYGFGAGVFFLSYAACEVPSNLWLAIIPGVFQDRSAAAAIAAVNTFCILGGFAGPYFMGLLKDLTGNYQRGLAILSIAMLLDAGIMLYLHRQASQVDPSVATANPVASLQ